MRYAIVAVLLIAFAVPAFAVAPPAGWGQDLTEWANHDGAGYTTPLVVWDPAAGDWFDGTSHGINYADINVELWIELYMVETYEYLGYQFHRLGNNRSTTVDGVEGELVDFIISGTLESNNLLRLGLTKTDLPLNHIYFQHDIFGNTSGGQDLPLSWEYRYGDGFVVDDAVAWQPINVNTNGEVFTQIAACDHWFQFKGEFFIPYHAPDGYYKLTIGGCPSPEL